MSKSMTRRRPSAQTESEMRSETKWLIICRDERRLRQLPAEQAGKLANLRRRAAKTCRGSQSFIESSLKGFETVRRTWKL